MQESFSPEHSCELFTDALEELLDSRAIADKGCTHLRIIGSHTYLHWTQKQTQEHLFAANQCKKAFLLNIAVNCSLTRLNSSWMAVVLPMKVALIWGVKGHDIKRSFHKP